MTQVQAYLDIREVNGYSIQYTEFHPADPSLNSIKCLVYIGLPNNPQFLGFQDPEALAAHILRSKGPSGENSEYLFMLERALEELGEKSGDGHVEDLARRARHIAGSNSRHSEEQRSPSQGLADQDIMNETKRVETGDGGEGQEEVEKL